MPAGPPPATQQSTEIRSLMSGTDYSTFAEIQADSSCYKNDKWVQTTSWK